MLKKLHLIHTKAHSCFVRRNVLKIFQHLSAPNVSLIFYDIENSFTIFRTREDAVIASQVQTAEMIEAERERIRMEMADQVKKILREKERAHVEQGLGVDVFYDITY